MWSQTFLNNILEIVGNGKNKSHIEAVRVDEAKLDALLHYPIKPSSIPLVSIESLYLRHKDKIRTIERDIPLVKFGSKFNTTELVEDVIKNYIAYCHLLPASEMDHHRYIGGLLEHSLDVSIRSLQSAMGATLDDEREIDIDQKRKPRYEYAAWLCGLLHDAGKIISNMTVHDPRSEQPWQPLNSNLFDWANKFGVNEYTVSHVKNRVHNEHETNSIHFLGFVINDTAKEYLIGDGDGRDDLYSKITQTLIGYHTNKGYLYNAVRKADGASTYNDYARVWMHDSHRDKSMVSAVVDVMRTLYFDWSVNKPNSEVFILKGEIYLEMTKPFKAVIAKCRDLKIPVPSSPKTLIEILIDKRIIDKVSDKSTFGNLYVGDFTEQDIHQFNSDKSGPIASTSPKAVVKIVWQNFVIGDNPIPDDAVGALRYNSHKSENTHTLFSKNTSKIVYPINAETKEPIPGEELLIDTTKINVEAPVENYPTIDTNKEMPAPTKMKVGKKVSPKDDAESNTTIPLKGKSAAIVEKDKQSTSPKKSKKAKTKEVVGNGHQQSTDDKSMTTMVDVEKPVFIADELKPSWVGKRVIKKVDEILFELSTSKNSDVVQVIDDHVVILLDYIATSCEQTPKDVIKEAEYLGLITINKKLPKKAEFNGIQQKIVVLSEPVASEFTYLLELMPKPFVDTEVELPQPKQAVAVAEAEAESASLSIDISMEREQGEIVNPNYIGEHSICSSNNEINHKLPVESGAATVTIEIFIDALKKDFPDITMMNLRPYLKQLKKKPFLHEDGVMYITSSQVEVDEIKYKIQQGITENE
ncbi:MobH family relaxase [Shewanella frigidimarina]|uniref:MobH family relaxase n=1 Tax=Shewanella frigidimarina TaxID=56812 RepID=UPI003D79F373